MQDATLFASRDKTGSAGLTKSWTDIANGKSLLPVDLTIRRCEVLSLSAMMIMNMSGELIL